MSTIHTTRIRDRELRAAAELIDRAVGKKHDREVTAGDLEKVAKLVDTGIDGLDRAQLDLIKRSLPELQKLLGVVEKKDGLVPFCTSLWVTAIADVKVRECARAITQALADGGEELSLAAFLDARDAVRGGAAKPGERGDVAAAREKLADAMAKGVINHDAVEALDWFFRDGVGGIMSHGPIRLNGISYDDCYRLPTKGMREALVKDAEKNGRGPENIDYRKGYAELIASYEERFRKLSYDRIYIVGREGELYVALNPSGKLDKAHVGDKASMRDEIDRAASGEVIDVVDVTNSLGEATWRPWVDGLVKIADLFTSTVKSAANKLLRKQIEDIADELAGGPDKKAEKSDLKAVATAGAYAATALGVAINLPNMLWVAGIAGTAMAAANLTSYLTKTDDKAAVFHAMGVTVNRSEAQLY
jgi:hypothetical protein